MYEQVLSRTGLTNDQALIYEALLTHGTLPASKVSAFVGLKRGLTYKVLGELVELKLVEKREDEGEVAKFEAAHPLRLKDLIETKSREAGDAGRMLHGVLPRLISEFNLVSGTPGIQFFEGENGVKQVSEDSLAIPKGETIYSYIDNEAVNKYIAKINEAYVKKRERLGIKKKMITIDSPYIRERVRKFNREITEVRVISGKYPFSTVMQIYDDKVSYLVLDDNKKIGIIIDDAAVARMHKALFEYMWTTARPIY